MSTEVFRVRARKSFACVHGHADHPLMWPTFVDASVFDTRRPREDDRRGQDRGHQEDVEERRLGGWHRASRRRVRAHGAQVQGHGGPVAGAAQKDGGRERAARALCRHHRQVARRRRQVLEEAAPHGRARVRASEGRGGLRRVVLDCAEVREEAPRGDGPRGGPEGRPGLPAAGLARRRVPGRLRPGGLRGEGRAHARPLPHGELPAPRRGPHAGLLGRGRRVRVRGARGRPRVRGRRARARGARQRDGGRQEGVRGGAHQRALQAVRRPLRARPRPRRPLLGQREGQRRERGRLPQAQRLRPGPELPRRQGLRPAPARGLPGHERQAPLPPRHPRARAVRGGRGRPARAAARRLLVREVGGPQVQQAGRVHDGRRPPLLRGPRLRPQGGRRRARRLRRHGGRPGDRRGGRHLRAGVGRRANRLVGPHAAAQAAVHEARRLARRHREDVPARRARRTPGRRGRPGPGARPAHPQGRGRRPRVRQRRRGHGRVPVRDGRHRRRDRRPLRGAHRLGGGAPRVRC